MGTTMLEESPGKKFIFAAGFFLASLATITAASYSPAITTTSGVVQGRLINAGAKGVGLDVYEFLGIPYAEPPTGDRRFKKPVAKTTSQGVLMAMKPPDACPQLFGTVFPQKAADIFMPTQDTSEDCLYVNIWAPRLVLDKLYAEPGMSGTIFPWSSIFNSTLSPLAVMVWLHGGNFYSGSSMLPIYNGSVLAAYNNVIVVSVQYRLGALGFSFFGDFMDTTPNAGLWDQLEALKWVKNNIGAFGGNANRTTLFGSDAGAASITYHLLSPYSKGFFQKAIVQSGSANAPTASLTQNEAIDRTRTLMDKLVQLRCPAVLQDDSIDIKEKIACLRNLEADEIVKWQDIALQADKNGSYGYMQIPFVPVIDGDFVPAIPRSFVKNKQLNKDVAVLIGVNEHEGSMHMMMSAKALQAFPSPLNPDKSIKELNSNNFTQFIAEYFAFYPRNNQSTEQMLRKFIEMHYSCDNPLLGDAVLHALSAATGDSFIACPVWEWARAQAEASNTFMYQFSHRSSTELWPKWMGVLHGDELPFVFGFPFTALGQSALGYTAVEKLLSRKVMTYWSNFAKYGDPNTNDDGSPNGRLLPLAAWPRFDNTWRVALKIDTNVANSLDADSLMRDFKRRDCTFWTEFFPDLVDLLIAAQRGKAVQPVQPLAPILNRPRKIRLPAAVVTEETTTTTTKKTTPHYEYYDEDPITTPKSKSKL